MYLLHYNVSAAVAGAPIIEQGTSAPLGAGRQLPETNRALVTIRDQCAARQRAAPLSDWCSLNDESA